MASAPKPDTDHTVFRLGPLAVVVAGIVAFGPLMIRSDGDEFYRRLHEKELKRREAGPPGI
jgi:hypothetical protein